MAETRKTVGSLAGAGFVVRYALTGPSAVPVGPDEDPRAPEYAKRILYWAERALAIYTSAPFHLPDPVVRKRITIRVKRFPALGRASRKNEIVLHNDLAPDVLALTVAHEFFHVIQYQFPRNSGRWRDAVIEGGAVYAEQFVTEKTYDASETERGGLRSFRRIVREPQRPLTLASYDCALFWDYVDRQAGNGLGTDTSVPSLYRSVIQRCSTNGFSAASVRRALATKAGGADLYRFRYDGAGPNGALISAETLIGNFAMAGCLADNGFASHDRRFALLQQPSGANARLLAVAGNGVSKDAATRFKALNKDARLSLEDTVGDFGSVFYGVDVDSSVETVQIRHTARCADRGILLQIGLVDSRGRLVDIVRTDRRHFVRSISLSRDAARIERLLLVVTGIVNAAEYQISVASTAPQPDVMLTRWDAPPGRELEAYVSNGVRTWRSPDLCALNGSAHAVLPPAGTLQQIDATLRNRGGADATGTLLSLFYQWAEGLPQGARWRPLRMERNRPATFPVERLSAGTTRLVPMQVIWPRKDKGGRLFVMATAVSGNDENSGNKSAITRFLHP